MAAPPGGHGDGASSGPARSEEHKYEMTHPLGCIPNYCPSANCPFDPRKNDPLNWHQPIACNLENPQIL